MSYNVLQISVKNIYPSLEPAQFKGWLTIDVCNTKVRFILCLLKI